jgi:hypothetical protein
VNPPRRLSPQVMSIAERGNAPTAAKVVTWSVYGLATVGGLAVVLSGIFPSAPFTALAIALAIAPLALTLAAPNLFTPKTLPRGASVRVFNPIAGIPAAAHFFRAVGMHMIDFRESWIVAGVCAAALVGVACLRSWSARTPIQLLVYMCLFGLMLGYGAATQANVRFDNSVGDPYRATVMDSSVSHSRRATSYTLELSPWGPLTSVNVQDVPYSLYQATDAGDSLCTRLHPGALHERWFTVDLCPTSPAAGGLR